MRKITARWTADAVIPRKSSCPKKGPCWHIRKPVCRHYHGTVGQVIEPYTGPVVIRCDATTKKKARKP